MRAVKSGSGELRAGFEGTGLLSGAMLASGVLAYAFHVVAARTLGVEGYGQVGVLWAAMFLAVIVLFRPLEQTMSRAIADRLTRGEEVRSVAVSIGLIYVVAATSCVVAALAAWTALSERLFLGDDVFTAALVAGTCGYGVAYIVRGACTGDRWFGGAALGIMADATLRLAVAIPLVVVASSALAAGAVAIAAFAGAVAPLWVGRERLRGLVRPGSDPAFRSGAALVFAGPAAVIGAADQLLVNGGPLLVMLDGGPGADKAAGVVFAATMLVRIPVYVFQGTAASLLPNLTFLNARQETGLFRRTLVRAAGVVSGVAILITLFAASVGPEAMRLLFGRAFDAGRLELTLLGLGVGFYLAASTFSQALLALDRVARAALAWGASAALFVVLFAVVEGTPLYRTAVAFVAATGLCVTLVGLAVTLRRPRS
jgi:O-antigen/teichoic acid export membrane protein